MRAALLLAAAIAFAACGGSQSGSPATVPEASSVPGWPGAPESQRRYVSAQPPSGDRHVLATGQIKSVEPLDFRVSGEPAWVLAAPSAWGLDIVVVLEDGTSIPIQLTGSQSLAGPSIGRVLMAAPAAGFGSGAPVMAVPDETASSVTVVGAESWWVLDSGVVIRGGAGEVEVLNDALPDGRVAVAADGTVAVLTGPTVEYPHGVLGDDLEAKSVTILAPDGTPRAVVTVDGVIEGLSPMWADLDGVPPEELIVTESDAAGGARIVVFDRDGAVVARGDAIGTGNRWRHQIGTVRDPLGTRALVVIKTPHIGGVAEFYRLEGTRLVIATSLGGVTSHLIGSRNIDMAVIADADGDGIEELIAPSRDRTELRGISLTEDGAGQAWALPLPAPLATNLFAVAEDGRLWLVAGLTDGTIRVWPPVASAG